MPLRVINQINYVDQTRARHRAHAGTARSNHDLKPHIPRDSMWVRSCAARAHDKHFAILTVSIFLKRLNIWLDQPSLTASLFLTIRTLARA